jgi:spermidine synthase
MASYLAPVTIHRTDGDFTPYLEVNLVNGKPVLDTAKVNYSFGGLHLVFQSVFRHFQLGKLMFKNTLILGFGAGSVASLLREGYGMKCNITGVEIDAVIIELGRKYFRLERYNVQKVIHDNAANFVHQSREKFDLIVMDVFIDDLVPKIFRETPFLQDLERLLTPDGILFYNFMTRSKIAKEEAKELEARMNAVFGSITRFSVMINHSENTVFVFDRSART